MSLICSDDALRALHRILICTRTQAYERVDQKIIADAMDAAEYLVVILQNREGLTGEEGLERSRSYLKEFARIPGYTGISAAFDEGTPKSSPHTTDFQSN